MVFGCSWLYQRINFMIDCPGVPTPKLSHPKVPAATNNRAESTAAGPTSQGKRLGNQFVNNVKMYDS